LREGRVDCLGVERLLSAYHRHHGLGVVIVLLHQIFTQFHRVRLRDHRADAETDDECSEGCAEQH
jgi:hypothetical protein